MITSNKKIVGLTGTFASGKDTLADFLAQEYHFMHLSTGDILRQEALRIAGSVERPVLATVANQLRKEQGADVFVQIAFKMFAAHADKYDGVVISGVRSIGEAEAIKAADGLLLFVDAPIETRYERMASRQRDQETALTLEEFKAGEEKELKANPTDRTVQNLGAMQAMADVQLTNNTELSIFLQDAAAKLQASWK